MSHINKFRFNLFLNSYGFFLFMFLLHFYHFLFILDSSKGFKDIAHVLWYILTHSYTIFIHLFAKTVQIHTLLINHLTILVTEKHYCFFLFVLEFLSESCSDLYSAVDKSGEGLDKWCGIEPLWWLEVFFIFVFSFFRSFLCIFLGSSQLSSNIIFNDLFCPIFPVSLFFHIVFGKSKEFQCLDEKFPRSDDQTFKIFSMFRVFSEQLRGEVKIKTLSPTSK